MSERQDFHRKLRSATRRVYQDILNTTADVAAPFGDALAFYSSVSGLGWFAARSLASAGYFYPNDVIRAENTELLAVKGIGPATLGRIRREMTDLLPKEMSVVQLMDLLCEQSMAAELPAIPRRQNWSNN